MRINIELIDCEYCKYRLKDKESHCNYCNNSRKIEKPFCNMCGNSMLITDCGDNYAYGLFKQKVSGAYNSEHLLDLNAYTFSLCEKCLRNLFNKFNIPPTVDDYHDGQIPYSEDKEIYDYSMWKKNGGAEKAYLKGKCNFVKNCRKKAIYSQFISNRFTENCCCEEHKNIRSFSNSKLKPFVPHHLKGFL